MAFDLPALRIALYAALALFSFLLFCFCAARLHYTTHLPIGDPLNGGRNFYDPIVPELLVAAILAMAWSFFIIHSIHKRHENRFISTFRGEIIGGLVIWILLIVGAAVATDVWGNLSYCHMYEACRVLSALLAFAWLSWVVLTIILGISLMFAFANGALREPLHGRWDPRASGVRPRSGIFMSQRTHA